MTDGLGAHQHREIGKVNLCDVVYSIITCFSRFECLDLRFSFIFLIPSYPPFLAISYSFLLDINVTTQLLTSRS